MFCSVRYIRSLLTVYIFYNDVTVKFNIPVHKSTGKYINNCICLCLIIMMVPFTYIILVRVTKTETGIIIGDFDKVYFNFQI